MYCRLTEEQFRPLLEAMLDNDRVKTEQMLKTIGEERMRFPSFIRFSFSVSVSPFPFTFSQLHFMCRRAGRLLDVAKDGYYDSDKCVSDFKKVIIKDRISLSMGCPWYIYELWINHKQISRLWTLWSLPLGGSTNQCSWSTTPPYTSMKNIKPWCI